MVPARLETELFDGFAVVMAAVGDVHSLALTADGNVWSFGCGSWGRLGLGDICSRLVPTKLAGQFGGAKIAMIAAGGSHSLAVTEEGDVWSWGCGKDGCLGLAVEDRLVPAPLGREKFEGASIVMVAAGHAHSVAVAHDGRMW